MQKYTLMTSAGGATGVSSKTRDRGKFWKEPSKVGLVEITKGHVLSEDGLKPDESKVEAIGKKPSPECKKRHGKIK